VEKVTCDRDLVVLKWFVMTEIWKYGKGVVEIRLCGNMCGRDQVVWKWSSLAKVWLCGKNLEWQRSSRMEMVW
jgi:hypothetical protein